MAPNPRPLSRPLQPQSGLDYDLHEFEADHPPYRHPDRHPTGPGPHPAWARAVSRCGSPPAPPSPAAAEDRRSTGASDCRRAGRAPALLTTRRRSRGCVMRRPAGSRDGPGPGRRTPPSRQPLARGRRAHISGFVCPQRVSRAASAHGGKGGGRHAQVTAAEARCQRRKARCVPCLRATRPCRWSEMR